MKLVQKKNKQLRIDDTLLQSYLVQGYVEIDQATGEKINTPEVDLNEQNEQLKAENLKLKIKLADVLNANAEEADGPEEKAAEEPEEIKKTARKK